MSFELELLTSACCYKQSAHYLQYLHNNYLHNRLCSRRHVPCCGVTRREQKNYVGNYTPYNPSINLSYARIAAPNAIAFIPNLLHLYLCFQAASRRLHCTAAWWAQPSPASSGSSSGTSGSATGSGTRAATRSSGLPRPSSMRLGRSRCPRRCATTATRSPTFRGRCLTFPTPSSTPECRAQPCPRSTSTCGKSG